MTSINKNTLAKAAALVAGFALVMTSFGAFAPNARAQTNAELQAQIAALLVQIAALQAQLSGGSVSCSVTFTRDLTIGSTGSDVLALQKFLNASADTRLAVSGAGSPGMETMYYGPITANAVARFQAKYRSEVLTPLGLVNPTGYFGPSSRAKANALCAVTPPVTPPADDDDDDDELRGGAGSVDSYTLISGLNNEEVGEEEEDEEVAGLEIEVDDGSDIRLTAVRLVFDESTAGEDFEDYADEISLWLDGEEVARVDADDFNDDNEWTSTVSVDRSAIIRAGDTGELVLAISGANNIDSADIGDTWTIDFRQIRFQDANGATISEDPNTGTRTFSFESFATASDLELKVRADDEDVNDARSISISDTSDTDNVEVLSFEIEVEGDSDVTIDDLTVTFTSTGAGVGEIINDASLMMDGDVVGHASTSIASTTATTMVVTFDDMDLELEGGETYAFIVRVDVNDLDGGFTAGDTLTAAVNPDDTGWDVEDEAGEDVGAADKTGSATSEAHSFHADGLNFDEGASDTATIKDTNGDTAGGERGVYTIRFDVTAFGDQIYVPTGATTATSSVDTDDGVSYAIEDSNGQQIGSPTTSAAVSSTARTSGDYYVVDEGKTESFTLTVEFTPGSDGFYRAQLHGVNYNVGSAAVADTLQQATPAADYQTDFVNLDA